MGPVDSTNGTNDNNDPSGPGDPGAGESSGSSWTSSGEGVTRNQYRRAARVQMDERKLLLRGGIYDGRQWSGVVSVGQRQFCGGDDAWSTEGIYVVTERVEKTEDGDEVNIAVPAFA